MRLCVDCAHMRSFSIDRMVIRLCAEPVVVRANVNTNLVTGGKTLRCGNLHCHLIRGNPICGGQGKRFSPFDKNFVHAEKTTGILWWKKTEIVLADPRHSDNEPPVNLWPTFQPAEQQTPSS